MHSNLAALLPEHKAETSPGAGDYDWLFSNGLGNRPLNCGLLTKHKISVNGRLSQRISSPLALHGTRNWVLRFIRNASNGS